MARNTSGLRRGSAPTAPRPSFVEVETPVFDPEALAVQTYGDAGLGFVQGKNYFTAAGTFVRELPEAQWYVTTPEMEANNRKARAKWRALTMGKQLAAKVSPAIPDKLIEAARENALAYSAEALAE